MKYEPTYIKEKTKANIKIITLQSVFVSCELITV